MVNGRWRVLAHGRRRLGSRSSRGSRRGWLCWTRWALPTTTRRGSRCTWPIWIGQPWPVTWPRPGPGRQLDGWRSRSAPAGGTVPTISASRDSPLPKGRRGPPIPTGCTQADSALFPPFWRFISVPVRQPSAGPSGTGTRSPSDSCMMAGAWLSWAARKTHPPPRCSLGTTGCATGPAGSRSPRPRHCWNEPTCLSAPTPDPPIWRRQPAHSR